MKVRDARLDCYKKSIGVEVWERVWIWGFQGCCIFLRWYSALIPIPLWNFCSNLDILLGCGPLYHLKSILYEILRLKMIFLQLVDLPHPYSCTLIKMGLLDVQPKCSKRPLTAARPDLLYSQSVITKSQGGPPGRGNLFCRRQLT